MLLKKPPHLYFPYLTENQKLSPNLMTGIKEKIHNVHILIDKIFANYSARIVASYLCETDYQNEDITKPLNITFEQFSQFKKHIQFGIHPNDDDLKIIKNMYNKKLLNSKIFDDMSIMNYCLKYNPTAYYVKLFLDYGAIFNMNEYDIDWHGIFFWRCKKNIKSDEVIEILKLLFQYKYDNVNRVTKTNYNLLHICIFENNEKIFKFLIENTQHRQNFINYVVNMDKLHAVDSLPGFGFVKSLMDAHLKNYPMTIHYDNQKIMWFPDILNGNFTCIPRAISPYYENVIRDRSNIINILFNIIPDIELFKPFNVTTDAFVKIPVVVEYILKRKKIIAIYFPTVLVDIIVAYI